MTRLRSCYFCGTTAGLSEYETLPDDLGEGDASRRVVLCDRCHAKLTNVLAPVVERFGEGTDSGVRDAGEHPGGAAASAAPDPVTESTADRSPQTDATFAGAVGDGDTSGESPTDHRPLETSESPPSEDSAAVPESTEPAATESAEAFEGPDPDDERVTTDAVAADSGPDATDAADTTTEVTDDPDATAGGMSETTAHPSTGRTATDDDLDRVYHKLLRFLRNREFPIPRAEAEAVAQSAYDLSSSESTTIVQRAVDRGVLEERDGELHRL